MRALGVNVAKGVIYIGVLDTTGTKETLGEVVEAPRRLKASDQLNEAERLLDLKNRFAQDLRVIRPDVVAVVAPRQYGGWTYRNAYSRVTAVAAVLLACAEAGISCDEVTTQQIAKVVCAPASQLEKTDAEKFGFEGQVTYWPAGLAEAFGAAALLVSNEAEREQ